jgi:hypothetical protein
MGGPEIGTENRNFQPRQNACSNVIPKLRLQQEKENLVQCGYLPALMKNKAKKHFTDTGKFGWRKSIKHKEMLCLTMTI